MGNRGQGGWGSLHLRGIVLASLSAMIVLGLFASVAVAASGTSASDQYGRAKAIKPAVVKSAVTSASPATVAPAKGSLPFTGISLLSVVVVGGGLVALGFALRRRNEGDIN